MRPAPSIQFDRPYDLFCSLYQEERTVFRNCKILGFTGHVTVLADRAGPIVNYDQAAAALRAGDDAVQRLAELVHPDSLLVAPRGHPHSHQ